MFPQMQYSAGLRLEPASGHSVEKIWTRNDITHKAKIVCSKCNNGWMNDIEAETSPILKPIIANPRGMRRLTKNNQSVLARWATLRTMVFDQIRENTYYSQQELFAFSTSCRKPPGICMYGWQPFLIWVVPVFTVPCTDVSMRIRTLATTHSIATLVTSHFKSSSGKDSVSLKC